MKKLVLTLFLFVFLAVLSYSQVQPLEVNEAPKSWGIDGTHLLEKENQMVAKYLAEHPDEIKNHKLKKSTGWGFTVGSTKQWYSIDFSMNNTLYPVSSTCRAVGDNCYIFVEDSLWGNRVPQKAVDSVRIAFDSRTPANSTKGVYQTDVETFGNPPDVDNDPKIIILLLNIKDGFTGTGGYVMGFFYSYNEVPSLSRSNAAEIYFLDANPLNLTNTNGLVGAMSTTAHEFQHMIHWNYNPSATTFINEGCSLFAEVNCGYSIYDQSLYCNETNHYLMDWRRTDNTAVLNDYSRAARFSVYLRDQFGTGIFKNLVQSGYSDINNYTFAIQKANASLNFNTVFKNFAVANILDDRNVKTEYGYVYPNLLKAVPRQHLNPNVPLMDDDVSRLGIQYLKFANSNNLKVAFTFTNPNLSVKAILKGKTANKVVDVVSNTQFSDPEYGTTYNEVDFAIINTDPNNSLSYNYAATGNTQPIEIKWDDSEPTGLLGGADQDTVCVIFDGAPDFTLDSVRVALRGTGSMVGRVFAYSNKFPYYTGSPLGSPLSVPFRAISPLTVRPGSPYPVPWQNWAKVDLSKYNIDATNAFAVAFVDSGVYNSLVTPIAERVMVTVKANSTSFEHSCTFATAPSSGSPRWLYYSSANPAGIYQFLIRAYVSTRGPNGVKETIELQPRTFSLSQNYPNPFNPNTTIEFSLTESEFVTLKVYNVLGEEVANILSQKMEKGLHKANWNAQGLSSGIYFYKIETGSFVETKKLVLMK